MKFIFKYKILLLLIAFMLFMLFFDEFSFVDTYKLNKEISRLKTEKQYYADEIEKSKLQRSSIFSDQRATEKYAREKFFMKKDNEDIYVIERPVSQIEVKTSMEEDEE